MKLDYKSELRERKALILARFTMAEAVALCFPGREPSADETPCPSCRAPGLNLFSGRRCGPLMALTDDYAQAVAVRCDHCGLDTDAVGYVQAARGWGSLPRTLDFIEGWLCETARFEPPPDARAALKPKPLTINAKARAKGILPKGPLPKGTRPKGTLSKRII